MTIKQILRSAMEDMRISFFVRLPRVYIFGGLVSLCSTFTAKKMMPSLPFEDILITVAITMVFAMLFLRFFKKFFTPIF